jgi:hypothetical protein
VRAQLGLEVRCKRPKKKGMTSNFHKFWNEEVQWKKKKPPKKKKKTLIFEHYNFMDLVEFGTVIFLRLM